MNRDSTVSLVALMLFVGAGVAFYWYEYRPSRIRAACEQQAIENAQASLKELMRAQPFLKEFLGKGSGKGLYNQDNKEAYYVSCVRAQGLDR